MWMSHVTHMWMSHVTRMHESRHTCMWVISHMWMGHVKHTNESCHIYERAPSHLRIRRVTVMPLISTWYPTNIYMHTHYTCKINHTITPTPKHKCRNYTLTKKQKLNNFRQVYILKHTFSRTCVHTRTNKHPHEHAKIYSFINLTQTNMYTFSYMGLVNACVFVTLMVYMQTWTFWINTRINNMLKDFWKDRYIDRWNYIYVTKCRSKNKYVWKYMHIYIYIYVYMDIYRYIDT